MAHARAAQKAKRPKVFKLFDTRLCATIEAWMDDGWSPKLIAEVLARDHPDDRLARVSHETIYQVPLRADPWPAARRPEQVPVDQTGGAQTPRPHRTPREVQTT